MTILLISKYIMSCLQTNLQLFILCLFISNPKQSNQQNLISKLLWFLAYLSHGDDDVAIFFLCSFLLSFFGSNGNRGHQDRNRNRQWWLASAASFLLLPCPPSPPPREQQLSDFVNNLYCQAYSVIQWFKKTITSNPKSVAGTWGGTPICSETRKAIGLDYHHKKKLIFSWLPS